MQEILIKVVIGAVSFALVACSNVQVDKPLQNKITTSVVSQAIEQTATPGQDSTTDQKAELTKIYTQAIAAFINAKYQNDETRFDTLFFGKHVYGQPDDFPDINLPEKIEGTPIRLITPEAGTLKQQQRKSLVYINLMGWVDKEKAEFIFVVFSNGAQHQYDYFVDFVQKSEKTGFELETIQFENYVNRGAEKPKRITVYMADMLLINLSNKNRRY